MPDRPPTRPRRQEISRRQFTGSLCSMALAGTTARSPRPRPFRIHVTDDAIRDLKRRLDGTRWPDPSPWESWIQGTDLAYLQGITNYWRRGFDWRAQEARLNRLPHFTVALEGLDVHFVHVRGVGPAPAPLLLTHGWPSSFVELEKIIPLLSDPGRYGGDPRDAFDVIVPSVPGFGFSGRPARRGVERRCVAQLWHALMVSVLGYTRFFAHGGDIGAGITSYLAFSRPEVVAGIHLTAVREPYLGSGAPPLSEGERRLRDEIESWSRTAGGYQHLQSTRPQTVSYALNDSPVGLAAWILEKYREWSDCDGDVERRFTRDELLTSVSLYWFTQTIGSSMRYYFESARAPWVVGPGDRVRVPTAVAVFPKDLSRPPREWAERFYAVQRWTEMPRGGHFAAHEEPELLAEDLRAFCRPLR